MRYTYRIHPLVKEDFEEGYVWYEERQKGLGEQFINAVDAKIKKYCLTRRHMEEVGLSPSEKLELTDFHIL